MQSDLHERFGMMKKRCFFLIITALLLAACQAGVKPVGGSGVAGVYTLSKVDGIAIPGTVNHDGMAMQISAGQFVIKADGKCISTTDFIAPGGNKMTRKVRAKYVVKDSHMIMTWQGAGVTEGTVEGDTFIMDNHGMIFEYTRQPSP